MAEDTMYLTTENDPEGKGLLAIITMGHPQMGDTNIEVLTLTTVPDQPAAEAWYERMKVERLWESRQ